MVATIGPLCTSAASTLALHLDRDEKRGRYDRGRLVRRAGRVFVRRRERRCRRATAGAEPTVPAQLLAMERTPGAWLSARGQGPGWRAETDEADGRRRDDHGGEARAGAVRAGGGRQRGPQPAGVEQVRGLRARTELALGWGQPVRGCESAVLAAIGFAGGIPPAQRSARHDTLVFIAIWY